MAELIFCSKCGIKCTGKMQLQDKKLEIKPVCQHCFVEIEMTKHLEEVKKRCAKTK